MTGVTQWSHRAAFESSFVVLLPVWLVGLIWAPTADYPNRELLQFVALVWLAGIGLLFAREYFVYGLIYRQEPSIRRWILLSLLIFVLSAVSSTDPLTALAYVGVTVVGLTCCGGLWYIIRHWARQCLTVYAVMGTAILAFKYLTASSFQARLSFGPTDPPNYLALVAYSILATCLGIRRKVLAYTLVGVNFVVIIATQGRGALIASVIAVTVYTMLYQTRKRGFRGALVLAGLGVLVMAVALAYRTQAIDALTSVLFINDRYRGVGTGFTGRLDAWREAFDLFRHHPILGVGFRQHERYMTILPSAHSGYLSMLAETGILGFLSVMVLISKCAWRLFRMAMSGHELAMLGMSFVGGYLFIAIFERFLINVGNPTSMLAWLFLLMPNRRGPVTQPEATAQHASGATSLATEANLVP